jgi:lysophospholipid acyltransferase (LPLAT)-like uncharacterized protein
MTKRASAHASTMVTLAGIVLGVVARLWLATLRVRVVAHASLAHEDRPWVLSFLHGKQWPLLAWRRRRATVVLVSLSRDGAMQSRALALQGLEIVRGSSSRGGARGLAAIVRRLKRGGADAAFAVDGPRGPYGVVKEGAVVAARATGALLVPMGSAASRAIVLRAWDRFAIAWPFTRVTVTLGAPIDPLLEDARAQLERAIAVENARAEALAAQRTAIASISTSASRGSPATATVARAGNGSAK